jgi:hypothetical protein
VAREGARGLATSDGYVFTAVAKASARPALLITSLTAIVFALILVTYGYQLDAKWGTGSLRVAPAFATDAVR